MPKHTCCFFGNRHLPVKSIQRILLNHDREIEHCISNGVSTFICGGALGFDQIAASFIIAKKGLGKKIRLICTSMYKSGQIMEYEGKGIL